MGLIFAMTAYVVANILIAVWKTRDKDRTAYVNLIMAGMMVVLIMHMVRGYILVLMSFVVEQRKRMKPLKLAF